MNSIDIVIIAIAGFFCVKGLVKGMILEVFTLAGLLLGYFIALRGKSAISTMIQKWIILPDIIVNTISFFIVFILIIIFFRVAAGKVRKFFKWTLLGWIDKAGGFLIGLFKAALVTSLIALLFSIIPFSNEIRKEQEASFFFNPVRSVAPAVFNLIKTVFPKTEDFYKELKDGFESESRKAIDKMIPKKIDVFQEDIKNNIDSLQKEVEKVIGEE